MLHLFTPENVRFLMFSWEYINETLAWGEWFPLRFYRITADKKNSAERIYVISLIDDNGTITGCYAAIWAVEQQ